MTGLVLVINLGSSSLKAALVDAAGTRIWETNHRRSDGESLDAVLDQRLGPALDSRCDAITLVGHRVVHGGQRFTAPTLITVALEQELGQLNHLAPLHNPPALAGLAWGRRWAPDLPQWACFDTAFTAPCRRRRTPMPYLNVYASRAYAATASTGSTTNTCQSRWPSAGPGTTRAALSCV